jgi:hypothetical protein
VATLLPGMLGGALGSAASGPERDLAQPGAVASAGAAAGAGAPASDAGATGYPQAVPAAGRPSRAPDTEYTIKDGASSAPDVAFAGGNSTQGPEAAEAWPAACRPP